MATDIFSINGSGEGTFWNFSNRENEGYSTVLDGQVVGIDRTWLRKFENGSYSNEHKMWPDGQPMFGFRLMIADANNNAFIWEIQKTKAYKGDGSPKDGRPNSAWNQVIMQMRARGMNSLSELIGHHITITTQEPPQGFGYSATNPRPWTVVVGEAEPHREGFDYETTDTGGDEYAKQQAKSPSPAPAPVAVPSVQVQQQYAYQQQAQQAVPQQPMMPQQVVQQAFPGAQVYPAAQPGAQAQAAQAPQGAQAYVEPELYDENIPF